MARRISILLITIAAFILFPFAVSANEPMSFSTEYFELNNVNFEIVSGVNGATLVLFGEYKNTRNIVREPHWEIESSEKSAAIEHKNLGQRFKKKGN